jgi:hypothetical protein
MQLTKGCEMINIKMAIFLPLIVLAWSHQSPAQTSTGTYKQKTSSSTTSTPYERTNPSQQTGISGDFGYTDEGATIRIVKYYGTGPDVSIPSRINGKPVTSIKGGAFFSKPDILKIQIPASISDVNGLFVLNCGDLTAIEADSSNPFFSSLGGVLFNKDKTALIKYPPGITDSTYRIPSGVERIEDSAFLACKNVSLVVAPTSLTVIGKRAFSNCDHLTMVTYPPGLTEIGESAFYDCSALEAVVFPASLRTIDRKAFYRCTALNRAEFLGNAPIFGDEVFVRVADHFSISYQEGMTGFTSPTWAGSPSEPTPRAQQTATLSGSRNVAFQSIGQRDQKFVELVSNIDRKSNGPSCQRKTG